MAVASYKLTSDGKVIASDQGEVTPWYSAAPAIGVGAGYEVMATVVSGSPIGTFDEWLTLSQDWGWYIEDAQAVITLTIRDVISEITQATATITLGE